VKKAKQRAISQKASAARKPALGPESASRQKRAAKAKQRTAQKK
jgi:hypothetical protein